MIISGVWRSKEVSFGTQALFPTWETIFLSRLLAGLDWIQSRGKTDESLQGRTGSCGSEHPERSGPRFARLQQVQRDLHWKQGQGLGRPEEKHWAEAHRADEVRQENWGKFLMDLFFKGASTSLWMTSTFTLAASLRLLTKTQSLAQYSSVSSGTNLPDWRKGTSSSMTSAWTRDGRSPCPSWTRSERRAWLGSFATTQMTSTGFNHSLSKCPPAGSPPPCSTVHTHTYRLIYYRLPEICITPGQMLWGCAQSRQFQRWTWVNLTDEEIQDDETESLKLSVVFSHCFLWINF